MTFRTTAMQTVISMDLDQLKQILNLVREHELAEFEIEQEGLRLKIRKDLAPVVVAPHAAPAGPAHDGHRQRRRR